MLSAETILNVLNRNKHDSGDDWRYEPRGVGGETQPSFASFKSRYRSLDAETAGLVAVGLLARERGIEVGPDVIGFMSPVVACLFQVGDVVKVAEPYQTWALHRFGVDLSGEQVVSHLQENPCFVGFASGGGCHESGLLLVRRPSRSPRPELMLSA